MRCLPFLSCLLLAGPGCGPALRLSLPVTRDAALTGTAFYRQAAAYGWRSRDSLAIDYLRKGALPGFYRRLRSVRFSDTDALGYAHRVVIRAAPDYFAVGTDADWARVPLTPLAAQAVADSLGCFLPTRRMVDLIHARSRVRLEPVPMYAYRDSTVTMWQHHLIIEGQRRGRRGLVSGIKKDVVLCSRDALKGRAGRVAIYGWHRSDGRPIQPLYTGHVDWYADYSHGARMVHGRVRIDGRWRGYAEILSDPVLRRLLSDEPGALLLRYPN